ncbi:hypothetical protein C2G38_2187382 [Gigaspora rosea]|uniref:Uncharacterized protein n=1 Tax=Gigaspora rosea TaxID=44941 RepID=A0A397V5R9_9GLOM|nr:hypothetical protein C2G38_2187382 [Gigaspora rosea]
MEQRLEAIRSHVQKLAVILKYGELIILERNYVTLCTTEEEVLEYVIILEKRTLSGRIQENMSIYLQDLNRGDSRDPFMPFKIPGEDWDRKMEKRKSMWKISKRVYQLFNARGEKYLYLVEHINITILEKMYDEDFTDRLLPDAWTRRQ